MLRQLSHRRENDGFTGNVFSPSTTFAASVSPSMVASKSHQKSALGSPIPRLERQSSATLDAAMRELDGAGIGCA